MGWLKKKFRQLDKRIRKIFGKKAWLKVAALVAGTYMGVTGNWTGGTGTHIGTQTTGTSNFGQFFRNIGSGIKNMFWNQKVDAKPSAGTAGTEGYIPGVAAKPAGLSWAGQAAASTGLSVVSGYGQAKLMEGDPVGQYVAAGSNEPSTLATVQNAYNAYAGQPVNILEVYNDLYYGNASTQVAENFLLGAPSRRYINVSSDETTSIT